MALQKKYYFTFKQIGTDDINLVEIWQDTTDVLVAEEVRGMSSPFIVEMPSIDHKFQVVIGKGFEVRLLSETDRKFLTGLFHVNPIEFQIRHYINGTLNYLGYPNSEMYQESFSDEFNYGISITGNDGFALADRFTFLDETEANYTGIKSKFELLMICLQRIGLPYSEIRISLSTTFTGYSGVASSTILHESYVDCANFYDEDDYPMTMRKVLESILAPYGAQIWLDGDLIYITDIHTKASGGSTVFNSYTFSTGLYAFAIAIPITKVIQNVGYAGTGQNIELSGGVNKQVVSYSPYPIVDVLEDTLTTSDEFDTIPASWSSKNGYFYKTLTGNKYYDEFSPATFESSYYSLSPNEVNTYIRVPIQSTNTKMMALKINPRIITPGGSVDPSNLMPTSGLILRITGEILVKTKANPYDDTDPLKDFVQVSMSAKIKIGDKYFNTGIGFDNTDTTAYIIGATSINSISDKFVDLGFSGFGYNQVGLYNVTKDIYINGGFEFELWSDIKTLDLLFNETINDTNISEIWIKNLSFFLVDFNGNEISIEDVEYIGELDYLYKDEGEKISLTCGTNARNSDRGKILYNNGLIYKVIDEWTRNAQTAKIEELLLVSATSNYRAGFYKLNNFKLRQGFSFINLFTDNNIPGKAFMLKSARFDYEMNDVECSLVEISPDNLTIVK